MILKVAFLFNYQKYLSQCLYIEAIDPYKQALAAYAERGRLHNAAKYAKELAEIYETDLNQLQDALYYYQKSADWYQAEDSTAYVSLFAISLSIYSIPFSYSTNIM